MGLEPFDLKVLDSIGFTWFLVNDLFYIDDLKVGSSSASLLEK